MDLTLGKRKRTTPKPTKVSRRKKSEEETAFDEDAQEIMRRHFEARFKPLPEVKKPVKVDEEVYENESEEEDEDEWDGISEEQNEVQVVEHIDAQARMAGMSKEQLKAFMSSKPPKADTVAPIIRDQAGVKIADDDPSEAANLKKDLALQRLLAESHLLDSAESLVLTGKNRHKATDMRLQALGSKTSILKQEKMPMAMRKGIITKAEGREAKRRQEAKENGIILEKATNTKVGAAKDAKPKMRDRGVGAPGVGRFSGGTLTLSKKDIYEIEGPKKSASGRGGRGGGRGRGKSRGGRGRSY